VGDQASVEESILGARVTVAAEAFVAGGCVLADDAYVGRRNRLERGMTLGPRQRLADEAVSFLPDVGPRVRAVG
jgi:carbonic anhydrase/acetyltransferase-like protein (isoleucine patch superfamily)